MTNPFRRLACVAAASALGLYAMLAGCDCTVHVYIDNDATLTFHDGSHHGGGGGDGGSSDAGPGDAEVPDAGGDGLFPDAGADGSVDVLAFDDAGPDAAYPDAETGADAEVPCAPDAQLYAGVSPMNATSYEISYLETVQVTYKGISLPGGTCNLMYFDTKGSPNWMGLCYNLPYGYEIPVAEGDTVKLLVEQKSAGETTYQKVLVWDDTQALRFLYYSGDPAVFDPVECADPVSCPVVGFAPAQCAPEDTQCGQVVHPPIVFDMGAGVCTETVQRGEVRTYEATTTKCLYANRRKLVAVDTGRMLSNDCLDWPNAWLSALIFDNRTVSQCMCRDHDDCADGSVCETEARRCVPIVQPEVPCETGTVPDPYTGTCFNPYDQSLTPCTTTADCAALGKGVCNTWWKNDLVGGFCQPNPCEVMDCARACSPLIGVCWECLAPCDCYVPEKTNGMCDAATHQCTP